MTWTTLFIAACWLLASALPAWPGAGPCRFCHTPVNVAGGHRGLPCVACHQAGGRVLEDPSAGSGGAAGCVQCHRGYERLFAHPMGTRTGEKAFIRRSFGRKEADFEQRHCAGCHLVGCGDCHGKGHAVARPGGETCTRCHKGYFVGWDYFGRAPREELLRFQRGDAAGGEFFLKMLPDVHQRRGMICSDCHTMQSLIGGRTSAKGCVDCHRPSSRVIEHGIGAHMEKMECVACHGAWAAQEYGTFFLRFDSDRVPSAFEQLSRTGKGYARSAYLKRQDLPPLGVNGRGRVSPIRPQFIAYYSRVGSSRSVGAETELLAAEWRAFTPHTVQRGGPMCDACHDNPRRFLLEPPHQRIYDLRKEGMTLTSFWHQSGQTVVNGRFLDEAAYRRISGRSPEYLRAYVRKWRAFVGPDSPSPR